MNFDESKKCFEEEILPLWDGWNPSEREQSYWILTLQKYTPDEVKKAVYRYYRENELYKKPKMPKFLSLISSIARERQANENKNERTHNPMFWLVCERDGTMKPIYGKIGRVYSPEHISNVSQELAGKWSAFYCERWFVVTSQDPELRSNYPRGLYPVDNLSKEEVPI